MNKPASSTPAPALSHLDAEGRARMVDISDKPATARRAVAQARVRLGPLAYPLLTAAANAKGDALNTARIAGILAAKRCAELIPLCHSLPLDTVDVDFSPDEASHSLLVRASCATRHGTGVEMEAMTDCSVAALTLYDMCKAADKGIVIEQVYLLAKSGGKSGPWQRPD